MAASNLFHAPYQLRRDYQKYDLSTASGLAHDMFQRRMEPARFNPENLRRVQVTLENALNKNTTDQLLFELAFVLVQNKASQESISRAKHVLAQIDSDSIHDDHDVARLRAITAAMSLRAGQERPTAAQLVDKVNWALTNDCPMVCRGCYHAFVSGRMTLEQAHRVVDKIAAHGTRNLVLSGGDPLLSPHLFQLLDHLKNFDIKIALDTTGATLDRASLSRLASQVTLLRLPLDGVDSESQDFFRKAPGHNLFPRLVDNLALCDELGFDRVVVHTVVSQGNIGQLDRIAEIVGGFRCVTEWVLFQWWPRRAPRSLISEMFVERSDIDGVVDRLKRQHGHKPIHFAPARDRALVNFFIQSDGQVATFASGYCEDFIVGNILHDSMESLAAMPAVDHVAMRRGVSGGISDW